MRIMNTLIIFILFHINGLTTIPIIKELVFDSPHGQMIEGLNPKKRLACSFDIKMGRPVSWNMHW